MKKTTLMLFIAGMMVLVLFAPAAMAADYPQAGQFIAHYDEDKLAKDTSSENGGTTYSADEAVSKVVAKATSPEVPVTAIITPVPDDWPQFMYDEENVGYSPCDGLPSSNTPNTYFDDREVIGTVNPVIARGYVFLYTGYSGFDEPSGLSTINLTCLYEDNLTVKWDFVLPRTQHLGSWGAPAFDGGYVYAASDNKIYKIRVSDGHEMWNFTTIRNAICNGGLTVNTGPYVFGSDWYGDYYCLFKSNGTMKWVFNNTDTIWYDMTYSQATPAYDPDEGTQGKMYVCGWGYNSNTSFTGYLYKVDVAAGTEDWSYGVGSSGTSESFCGSPSLDENNVYIASYSFNGDGNLYRISKDRSSIVSRPIERTDATPSIDLVNDRVYISGGWNGGDWGIAPPGVRCFQTDSSLTPVWTRYNESMGGWTGSVTIGEDSAGHKLVFAGKESGDMNTFCYNTTYALYANNGTTKWSYPAGGATAAIANDKVYTAGNDGKLYVFG
ncbi:outer membrane protein assembly factor BamB family protein [Methanolacinia paynteri]|uniref:outer membrane protein assembly factor BamB family protein n=1 Tax=Methanolacinia paynteri TaxID=230356 RepID=UPI00064F5BFA|nr:PQQ-binding-like beta-propeller repeat protein [Methanolacinia paynteri]